MATYTEQLASVQAAIARIEAGNQSYTISAGAASRSASRADLKALYDREKYLRPLADREALGRTGRRTRSTAAPG